MNKLSTIIELGSIVTDTATDLPGMLVHLHLEMDGAVTYAMQPRGLNSKTGAPLANIWLTRERIVADESCIVKAPDLPYEVLGTHVTDRGSGFSGMAVSLCLHINGCVHVNVQPKGRNESGQVISSENLDIRRLEGPAIRNITVEERRESHTKYPSPAGDANRSFGDYSHFSPTR